MTMESDDDLDHLVTSQVSEVRKTVTVVKASNADDAPSEEDEATSIKSESDDDEETAGESLRPPHTELPDSDVSIKSEPESENDEDDDAGDAEKDLLISNYLSALKSSMSEANDHGDESDDEDDVSIKSEDESEDEVGSVKSEPETESDSELPQDESNEIKDEQEEEKPATAGKKQKKDKKKKEKIKGQGSDKKAAGKSQDRSVKKAKEEKVSIRSGKIKSKVSKKKAKASAIDQPGSIQEKELMSLVFGGKDELVSNLTKSEKKSDKTDPAQDGKKKKAKQTPKKRRAVWHDSDDDDEEDAANMKRNKFTYDELPEQLTKERRRKQFEQIVGQPKWADLDRVREPDSDEEMLQTVGHVVKGAAASQGLPKGMIELKKLKNLNRETKIEGKISCINFHPTSMVAMMTGNRGLVSIVAVDGVRNEKLHTLWLQKVRISCSRLSPDGNEAIFGSYRKFFHVYNLLSGQSDTLKIPERETWQMKNFRISRCGRYLASVGECGEVHLMDARTKDVLQTIQLRYTCQSLAFTPDSRYLLCHSNDTEVSVFSLEQKRIVNVFQDEGCVNGSCIAICPNGQFVATGSRQGIVNLYTLDVTLTEKQPVPVKTFNNLTTYIDSLAFNATSELLVIASSTVKNAVRLIHVKSRTVFRNFPLHMTHLGHVSAAEFSPSGGYLALGTKQSTVLLFRVKHYPNY
uniref:Uncharacterized protein n=1 Tax=Anopheles quadriannulatus TaxID=34691 RepID=A0A182X875_ANOQN